MINFEIINTLSLMAKSIIKPNSKCNIKKNKVNNSNKKLKNAEISLIVIIFLMFLSFF